MMRKPFKVLLCLSVWIIFQSKIFADDFFKLVPDKMHRNRYSESVSAQAIEIIASNIPKKISKTIPKISINIQSSPLQSPKLTNTEIAARTWMSDFLLFEEHKTLISRRNGGHQLDIYPDKLLSVSKQAALGSLSRSMLYDLARLYLKHLPSGEKKDLMNSFQLYPVEIFNSSDRYFRAGKENIKRFLAWQIVQFILNKEQHKALFPFSAYLLDRHFNDDQSSLSFKDSFLDLPLRQDHPDDKPDPLKHTLFSSDKSGTDFSVKKIIRAEHTTHIPFHRIWGVSLLLAGDEGASSKGVGHSGLVIWVCPEHAPPGLKTCLNNIDEHIAFNPVGDTSFYEHSPVRKIIAGGFTGDFPMIYSIQPLKDYLSNLNDSEKRDALITPPVVSRKNPEGLYLTLARIQETALHNLTKSYLFFSDSCVHSCYRLLKTSETFTDKTFSHSFYRKHRILPFAPVTLWRYFEDRYWLNLDPDQNDPELNELWTHFSHIMEQWFHLMFKGSSNTKWSESIKTLQGYHLLWLTEDDGLSKWTREKKQAQAKRLTEISEDITIFPDFSDAVLTTREFAMVHPGQKISLISDLIRDEEDPFIIKKAISEIYQIEREVFLRLDEFFEKSKVFNEALKDLIKENKYIYHLSRSLDLSFHRHVSDDLTPFNIYAYLVYQEKSSQYISRLQTKFKRSGQIPDQDILGKNLEMTDKDTRMMIKNFFKISDQIHDAINQGHLAAEKSFKFKFNQFWNQWKIEWETSAMTLNTLNDLYKIFENETVIYEDPQFEAGKILVHFEKMMGLIRKKFPHIQQYSPGKSHQSLDSNLSVQEWYSRQERLKPWLKAPELQYP